MTCHRCVNDMVVAWHRRGSRRGSDMCTKIGKHTMIETQSDKNAQWDDGKVRDKHLIVYLVVTS